MHSTKSGQSLTKSGELSTTTRKERVYFIVSRI